MPSCFSAWYTSMWSISFIADAVGLLRRDLPGLEGLANLIAQHIRVPPLLPACGSLVLGLAQKALSIGGHVVAAVGRDQFAALRLVRVLPIVKPLFQGLGDGFTLADLVLFEIGCGRRQPSFQYDKRQLFSAAAQTLGHFVSKYKKIMLTIFF